jgi:hypothetical protein
MARTAALEKKKKKPHFVLAFEKRTVLLIHIPLWSALKFGSFTAVLISRIFFALNFYQ